MKITLPYQYIVAFAILLASFCTAAYVHASFHGGIVDSVPSPSLCVNGNVQTPSSWPSTYSQGSYYGQGSYSAGYGQGSYASAYGQSSYGSGYGQGSYSLVSSGGEYGQGAYFTCPSGQTVVNGNSCCPNANVVWEDTGKGQRPVACTNAIVVDSCPVNGTTVANGGTYTFYTMGNVPYGETCAAYAQQRTCQAGQFSGSDAGFYSTCVVDDAPQISTITIDAIPPIVRYGEDSTIVWDGGNAEACTVTGYGLTNVTGVTGSEVVDNVTGESVYTLNCTLGPNSRSASTTLKVLPRTQET